MSCAWRLRRFPVLAGLLLGVVGASPAQEAPAPAEGYTDSNVLLPVAEIEHRLREREFEVLDFRGSRFPEDRTQRVALEFPDGQVLLVKWAMAPRGGGTFNNRPRYEIAAYELQKLFLDPSDYVVPPTVARALPLELCRRFDDDVDPTFDDADAVLVALQYWLFSVTSERAFSKERMQEDPAYARHLANLNLFTHLARHSDANVGNILVSTERTNPRLFAVDNGVAFGPEESDRGHEWRELRVKRLPAETVERLRAIDRETLDRALGVVAQFEVRDETLVPVERGPVLDRFRGVRREGDVIQLGLTSAEIAGVDRRLRRLLEKVDAGRVETF